jgi:hypothetical protein
VVGSAIVALAFGVGFGGRQLLSNDGRSSSSQISAQQAGAVPLGITRTELVSRLDVNPTVARPVGRGLTCLFYPLADQPNSAWAFCFAGGKLRSSSSASSGAPSPPSQAPLPVHPAH